MERRIEYYFTINIYIY